MGMYTTIGAHPEPKNVSAWIFGGSNGRHRLLLLEADATRVEILVRDLAVLDAIQDAIDAIRADMPARSGEESAA